MSKEQVESGCLSEHPSFCGCDSCANKEKPVHVDYYTTRPPLNKKTLDRINDLIIEIDVLKSVQELNDKAFNKLHIPVYVNRTSDEVLTYVKPDLLFKVVQTELELKRAELKQIGYEDNNEQ